MHLRLASHLLGLFALLTLGACSTLPLPVRESAMQAASPAAAKERSFHVASHGWHTSVIVPAADLLTRLPQLGERFPNRRFFEIGWGDAGFYQAREITLGITLQAMFIPSTAVVHVVGFDEAPERYFAGSEVVAVHTTVPAYADLLTYLAGSFQQGPDGALAPQSAGLYGDAQFYTGVGSYTLINTCNKWTAKALYSAGLPIATTFKLTASSVMRSVRSGAEAADSGTAAVPAP